MDRRRQNRPAGPSSSSILLVVTATVVVLAGLGVTFVLTGGSGSDSPAIPATSELPNQAATTEGGASLPDYVMALPLRVQEAYIFAAERPDVMVWMPCYCGCGEHSGHKSAHNCFVKEDSAPSDIDWDMHGAGCDMCVGIALDTKAMIEEGKSLADIRTYIDDEYGSIGPGTDTPLPPG